MKKRSVLVEQTTIVIEVTGAEEVTVVIEVVVALEVVAVCVEACEVMCPFDACLKCPINNRLVIAEVSLSGQLIFNLI